MIDVVIADQSPLVTRAMVQLFEDDERFSLLATTNDGERFLEAARRFPFTVGVIGWETPYLNGRGVLERLRGQGRLRLMYEANPIPSPSSWNRRARRLPPASSASST